MPSFSERMGFTEPKQIQVRDLDDALRNSLWNVCKAYWFTKKPDKHGLGAQHYLADADMYDIAVYIYKHFHKEPVDDVPEETDTFIKKTLALFQSDDWFVVLNLVEFLREQFRSGSTDQQSFTRDINYVLEREKSAYRFVDGILSPLSNQTEVHEVESAMRKAGRFAGVATHMRTALGLFSKKPEPDYRNSIKESISAVEAAARVIAGLPKATLGEAIKQIDEKHPLHGAFKEGILKLYGYSSDEAGIRHALTETATNVDEADARFMLVSCSAFANYLISRYDEVSA